MLLSRVAESVYWAGRYLERAEATARLVQVHTELFLDLPKAAGVGWTPLLAVTGSGEAFRHHHREVSEEPPALPYRPPTRCRRCRHGRPRTCSGWAGTPNGPRP